MEGFSNYNGSKEKNKQIRNKNKGPLYNINSLKIWQKKHQLNIR